MKRILIITIITTFIGCSTNNAPADGDMIPILSPSMNMEPYNDGSGLVRVTS